MNEDIYFTCTHCGHTILTDIVSVGASVECPDCRKEMRVPTIKDGIHPRFRHAKPVRGGALPPGDGWIGLRKPVDLVQKGLVSLERRQTMQVRKVTHLVKSLSLFREQLEEVEATLKRQSPSAASPEPGPVPEEPPEDVFLPASTGGWERLAMAASVLVILGCLATAVYWLAF